MSKIKSKGPKTDPHVRLVTIDTSKLHSILQVRMEPVIYYASNTIIVEFSEKYIVVNSVKYKSAFLVSQEILHKHNAQNRSLA